MLAASSLCFIKAPFIWKSRQDADKVVFTAVNWECFHGLTRKSKQGQSFQSTSEDMFLWTLSDCKVHLLIVMLWDSLCTLGLKPTRWPLYPQKPLLLVWNAPTQECGPWRQVFFQLDQFHIVATPNEGFVRQNLTMFYKDRLGLYPFLELDETAVNGGLPQVASLTKHLEKMEEGVRRYIPEADARGLAVIDWEEWRPIWMRNWGPKHIYRNHSVALVQQKNPTWPREQVSRVAQQEFEISAKKFMLETLRHAKHLRPNQLWGFYLFPDCYNHDYLRSMVSYTGRCPDVEVARNERLEWLWTESTALFPSIYMGAVLRSTASGRQFVRNRVKEGMRLASSGDGLARPVFVYTRPTYINSLEQLTEADLVSSIGESAALGAAGIILWGDATYARNKTTCSDLEAYVRGTLSLYLLNVSTAAELCSQTLCSSYGRCLRKDPDSDVYLHLNPLTHTIQRQNGKLTVSGELGQADKQRLQTDFQCQCYSGFQGERCDQADSLRQRGLGSHFRASALLLVILLVVFVIL